MWRERLKKLLKQKPLKNYLKQSLGFSLLLTFLLILLPIVFVNNRKEVMKLDTLYVILLSWISKSLSVIIPFIIYFHSKQTDNDVILFVTFTIIINYILNYIFFLIISIQADMYDIKLTKDEIREYRINRIITKR